MDITVMNPRRNRGYNIIGYCELGVMLLRPKHLAQIERENKEIEMEMMVSSSNNSEKVNNANTKNKSHQ